MLASILPTSALTPLDWALIAVIAISTLLAFQRGLIRVVFSLAGLIAGTLAASAYYVRLAVFLGRWVTSSLTAQAIAFLGILFAVWILFAMAGGLVRKTVRAVGLGFADRLLGAATGLIRGVLLGVGVMMALAAFDPHSGLLRGSRLAPYFLRQAHAVSFVVPQNLRVQMADGVKRLREKSPGGLNRTLPPQ